MSWQKGTHPGTWFAGNGKMRRELVGETIHYGPRGQRYIIRKNKFKTIFNIPDGKVYTWGNWDGESDSLTTLDEATKTDWDLFWENGQYQPIPEEEWHTPEEVAEANSSKNPNLSFLNDNRTELTAAAIVAAIVLIVIIAKA